MNQDLLEQQVKALRWSKGSGEMVYNAANVVQFCLQQLLQDDAAAFSSYMEKQPEARQMFGDIQKMAERFLEKNLEECTGSLKNRIAPKLEHAKAGTQNYLGQISEMEKRHEGIAQAEETLQDLEHDVAMLEKELDSINEWVRELTKLQEKLSGCPIQQLEQDVEELEKKIAHEKEALNLEEKKEKRLNEQVQALKNHISAQRIQIEEQCGRMLQESSDILKRKKASENNKKEHLQNLKQREREYLACWGTFENICTEAKSHLTENEKTAEQMIVTQVASDEWMVQRDKVAEHLNKKLDGFAEVYDFIKRHMDSAVHQRDGGKEQSWS